MKGKRDVPEMSNADLKRMLDQTMTRFENWRIEESSKGTINSRGSSTILPSSNSVTWSWS
jgi:hypothetical protein